MEDDVAEGNVIHELAAGHDHARDPEEDDVGCGAEVGRRVVAGEVGGLVGPAERREGPEPGREPGVENVGVLRDRLGTGAALRAFRRRLGRGPFVAARAGVDGDAMPPPDLAGDAPVTDVLHPVEVGCLVAFGRELDGTGLDSLDGLDGEGLHADEPLL